MSKNNMSRFLIYITILLAPAYLIKLIFFSFPTNLLEILEIFSIAFWIFENRKSFFKKVKLFYQENIVIDWAILGLILGAILSAAFNDNLTHEFSIIKSWFVLPIIFSFIAALEFKNEKNKLLSAVFYSTFWVSLASLFYLLSGNLTYDHRLKAFFLSPNHLAMFIAPGIIIGIYFFQSAFGKKLSKTPQRVVSALAIFLITLVLFFTHSYANWLAILIALLIYFFLINKNKKIFLFIFAVLLAFIFLESGSEKFKDLINFSERSSASSRLMIWQSAGKILKDNWLWGIGAGNFQEKYLQYQKYFPPYLEWAVPQPHNLFLAFWLQTGLLGFLSFLILLAMILKKIFLSFRSAMENKKEITLYLSFFIYLIIAGLFDTPYWKNDLSLIFWIFFFLPLFLEKSKHNSI